MRPILHGAWRTAWPAPGDRHGPLPPLLLGLTVLSGIVDAVSYLMLGHVFVSNMTGNVVFLGFALAGTPGFSITSSLIALAAFAVGAFAGGRLVRSVPHRGRALLRAALAETVLLAIAALVIAAEPISGTTGTTGMTGTIGITGADSTNSATRAAIAVMAVAMGIQNAVVQVLAVPDLTTTVVTRTLVGVFADSGIAGGFDAKAGRRLLSVLSLGAGAAAGAVLVLHASQPVALAAPAALAAVLAAATYRAARSSAQWARHD